MSGASGIYYKVRDVVRRSGHPESDSCRVFKDWHIELRAGSGHVSVWTSDGIVFLTMSEIPVYYKPGSWEEHLNRLHAGRPEPTQHLDLRHLLRSQLLEEEAVLQAEAKGGETDQDGYDAPAEHEPPDTSPNGTTEPAAQSTQEVETDIRS